MLNKIIAFSIRNKLLVGLFTIALLLYGLYEVKRLPIDAVPDITNNQVQIITVASSYGATDIERLITFPIEQANSNINGIKELRSFSRFGLSVVTIVFDEGTDVFWARQQVSERLQKIQSQIPASIGKPELGPITTGLGEIYQYVVRPLKGYENSFNDMDLRTIQDWIVRRQLLTVKGVAEVSSFGGKLKQFEIAINPDKLHSFNLSIKDVFGALEKNNQNTGGAYIEKGPTVLFIRSEGLVNNENDIANIPVKTTASGYPVFIRDVAEVHIGYANRFGAMVYNDDREVSGGIVMMLKGANSNEVITNVKNKVAFIQSILPKGLVIEAFLDRTKMVNNAIGTVETNLMEGALIVVFILVLFLGNFRAGLLVASVIPLAMLFAVILMNLFGVSGNLMSLGALDFGLIVDGAVIIVEAVMHQLTHKRKNRVSDSFTQSEVDVEVEESAGKMMNSAVFGQIIILIVYLPIFTLQGIEGKMFKPMAQTVAFALLGAFVLSLTYIPMMSSVFLSKKVSLKKNWSENFMIISEKYYQLWLNKVLAFPKTVITAVLLLFVIAIILLTRLGGEFIPALEEGDFAVETRVLTGSNIATTIASTKKAAAILLQKFPEVEKVVTKIGSGEVPTDPMPMEAADMMVILKDKKEWTSAKTFPELSTKMSDALKDVPGITTGFQFPVQMRFNELMTGARQDIVCKIFGDDLDSLSKYANKLGAIVNTVKGATDLYIEQVNGMPQVVIRYDRNKLAQYNVNIDEVNMAVNSAFAGQTAGMVFEGERRFEMVLRLSSNLRNGVENIQNLLIPTPNGNQIPLHQLAEVEVKIGPNQIQREDTKRRIVIGFNARERDVQSIVGELQEKVKAQVVFPNGYYLTYGGSFENLNQAKDRLAIAVPVSLVLIFILLFFAFNSVKHSLLIYTAIPLSAIGGIYFLSMRQMPFSISAGVGFIALFGVAVLNGIVLLAEFNRLKESGLKDLQRIVLMGTKVRLRPVLMTAFVASLGFLPMAVSNGAGAEVQRPLATVVIGGLLLATFLTLFVLPVLYILFESGGQKKHTNRNMVMLLLACLLLPALSKSQVISLEAAGDSAVKNNLQVRNQKLLTDYRQKLMSAAVNLPQTGLSAEFGQINSSYTDSKIGLLQSFNFPAVYARQKAILRNDWLASGISYSLSVAELKKNVSAVFYDILLAKEKEKLLTSADSMYTEFIKRAELRYTKGETNILEKTSAQLQQGNVQLQLKQVKSDINLLRLAFQLLLNVSQKYEPQAPSLKLALPESNAARAGGALQVKLYDQFLQNGQLIYRLEKARLLPEINLAYVNQSIRGIGADDKFYVASQRFHVAQVGIGLPLFYGAQRAKIQASKMQLNMAQNDWQQKKLQYENELNALQIQLDMSVDMLRYVESVQLPYASQIAESAHKQFMAGEINYLDWTMLMNQSIQLRSNYLDAIKKQNELINQINYLISR
jgi:cobalt-zinc-cadmium resistance protein CzcA